MKIKTAVFDILLTAKTRKELEKLTSKNPILKKYFPRCEVCNHKLTVYFDKYHNRTWYCPTHIVPITLGCPCKVEEGN